MTKHKLYLLPEYSLSTPEFHSEALKRLAGMQKHFNGRYRGRLTLTDVFQNFESASFTGTTDGLPFSRQI